MADRKIWIPDTNHPMTIDKYSSMVIVKKEAASYRKNMSRSDAFHYIPRRDMDMSLLERSQHTTYCP